MATQDDTNPNDWMRDRNLTRYILEAMGVHTAAGLCIHDFRTGTWRLS